MLRGTPRTERECRDLQAPEADPTMSHWLGPCGSSALQQVVGLHLEMAANGRPRATVLATSSTSCPAQLSQQFSSTARQRDGKCQAAETSNTVSVLGANQAPLTLIHHRNHRLRRTPSAAAHHLGPDLGPAGLGRNALLFVCLPLDGPTCSSPRAQRQEQEIAAPTLAVGASLFLAVDDQVRTSLQTLTQCRHGGRSMP